MKLKFKKLISPALAFSLVSTATLSGSVVHGAHEDKDGEAGLSVMDALSLSETIDKNVPEPKSKGGKESGVKNAEGDDAPTQEDVKRLYNVFVLKMLKKAADSKEKPKTLVGRAGDELKDLGKNIKPILVGVSAMIAAGFVALPVALGVLERCGMDLREALYFLFPGRAESMAKLEGIKLDNAKKALQYGSDKSLYDNWPFFYHVKESGGKIVAVFASAIATIKWW